MTTYNGDTFLEADLLMKLFAGDTFTNCTFDGRALRSNFHLATFSGCTFNPGFKFEDCLVTGTTGLSEDLIDGGNYSTKSQFDEASAVEESPLLGTHKE